MSEDHTFLEALLRGAVNEVPEELAPHMEREAMSAGLTYEDLMALIRRVEESPYGSMRRYLADEAPDVFEEARQIRCVNDTNGDGDCAACARNPDAPCRQRETRAQAKTRIMLEMYARDGREIRDRDLWNLRAQYVWVKQYVQGRGEGLPYNTHNWTHFYNRYGMGGLDPVYMIGLRVDTVERMTRYCAAECAARDALRILPHD